MSIADALARDLRHGLRSLLLRPGFTLTVVATLALGLGVNAAIFSLFHEVLMRPLPVPEPQRLVNLSGPGAKSGWMSNDGSGDDAAIFSYPMFRDLEQAQGDGVTLAGHRGASINLDWQGRTSNNQASMVSGNYFNALGLVPALGRLLSPQDDAVDGRAESVVLAHGLWLDRFGADPDIIGRTLRINGLPMTVVGVAPQGFEGTTVHSQVELFLPISVHWPDRPESLPEHQRRDAYWVYVFGRLAPGVTPAAALAPLQARYRAVINQIEVPQQQNMTPDALQRFADRELQWLPGARGQSEMPGQLAAPLATLLAVAGLVLLIACVNIANLQLARGAGRRHEMSVRSAIGASSGRLARQLLIEAGLLALAGAVLALPLGWLVARGLVWFDSTGLTGFLPGGLSWAMTGFVFAAAAVTVLLFGLFPAWQLSRATPADALRTRTSLAGGHGGLRLRNGLAVAQMAFSLALLVLAGLFVRSLDNLGRVDLGMQTGQVLAFGIGPELNGYPPERSQALFQRLEAGLQALPGVDAVGLSMVSLVSDNNWGSSVSVQGYQPAPDERTSTSRNDVSPGFFQTLGIPLLAGRQFSDSDDAQAPRVAIVNQAFAERYDLGNDAVGKHVATHGGNPELDIRIVGVVGNSAYSGVREEAPPQLYLPLRQNPGIGQATVYLRSALPSQSLGPAITRVVNNLDSGLPVMDLRSFSEQVRRNTGTDHLVGMLSSGFAVLATLLAAIGLYGLLAYTVAQRQHEMGLRLALGAPPARLRALVLRQTARLALIGIVIGLILAVALGNAAGSLLYGLTGQDPLVLALATLLLLAVVLAAAWWPAWRASRTDPMVALREE